MHIPGDSSENIAAELDRTKRRIKELEIEIEKYKVAGLEYPQALQLQWQKEEEISYLFDHIPLGIMLVDQQEKIKQINKYIEIKTNKNREEMIGKKGGDVLDCVNTIKGIECGEGQLCNSCQIKYNVKKVIETNMAVCDFETNLYVCINGKYEMTFMRLNIFPYMMGDKKYVLLIIEDICKEKENKKLEGLLLENERKLNEMIKNEQMKNQFLANVSHDFKMPANIILGVVQLMEIMNEGEDFNRHIRIIRNNCHKLIRLVNNAIDTARINLGFFEINLKNKNIVEIIRETTLSTVEYAKTKEISVIFSADIDKKIIACDEEKIERVVLNLLSNAIRHTNKKGKVTVRIYEKNSEVYISVKDTGVGIPLEIQGQIFNIFWQANCSAKKNNGGSGIGLFIVKSIIDLHNGKIQVKSEEGQGSEFIISLPAKVIDYEDRMGTLDYEIDFEKLKIELSDIL